MKKILFLTYDFPYPFNSGGKIRAYNMLAHSKAAQYVTLFSFTRGPVTKRQLQKVKDLGITSIHTCVRSPHGLTAKAKSIISSKESIFKTLYYMPQAEKDIIDIIRREKIGIVHAESFYTGYYLNDAIRDTGVKTVFGTENIEHKLYQDYVASSVHPIFKRIYQREVDKIKQEEYAFANHSDVTLTVSHEEANYFNDLSPRVEVIENGIDLSYFAYHARSEQQPRTILFVGNFKYFPNIEAVKFLYSVFKKLPTGQFELMIIGKDASKLALPRLKHIQLIEYIEDIRDAYKNAHIFAFPVRLGGGTNFKILEAMATGVPVVGHPIRLSAFGVKPGTHFVSAESEDDYVREITGVTTNGYKKMTLQARKFVEQNYSWDHIGKKLADVWKSL